MALRTLLFTDVVDSTLLVERLGDGRAAQFWAEHDRRARDLLAQHRGLEIERTDGFFLLFDAPADAARYALAYHQALAEITDLAPVALAARVGLHVGAVTLRENTPEDIARGAKHTEVEGLAKPFAARVMALARGGQTLLSASARAALGAPGAALPEGAAIESHGHYRLKGVEEPVELFELGLRADGAFSPPPDADKAYRVVRSGELWRPLRELRHNLPAERDAFIGRRAELRALAQRLDAGARLVTVLGPGGTGKTRLVRRYGHAWLGDWPGGACFCDLSEAKSLDGVLSAVAVALGVPLGKGDAAVQLGHAIAGRGRCLVILDNFEQVLAHAPASLGHWLDRAGEAAFIVTSRERLHLSGEEVFPIEPLPLDKEAIELFEVRARAQRPDFVLGDANRAAVAEVVRLLDGLPLAIELAAARVRVLSPAQLVERMRDRFRLLAGARGAAARQATLRAVIDWSWDLLTPWEQAALAQCSVFEGGFTLEASEAVLDLAHWPDAPAAMDAVQALVDKSLLRTWSAAEQGRYDIDEPYFGMYISIHEYAVEKLGASAPGAVLDAEVRHGAYFAGFGTEAAIEALSQHGGVRRRGTLALELDNLVCACRRAMERRDGATAVATYRAAWEVLDLQGPFALGATLGTQVLALDGMAAAHRCAAGLVRGLASRRLGRVAEAETLLLQTLTLARAAGNRSCEAAVLRQVGLLRGGQGRMDESLALLEASLAVHRELGDRRAEGLALGSLANLYNGQSRLENSLVHYEAALAIHREVGDRRSEGAALSNLGNLCQDAGRMDEARAHHAASIAIHRELGNRLAEGIALGNLATLHNDQGRLAEARLVYEAALAIHREVGDRPGEGVTLGNLGKLCVDQGRMAEALGRFQGALAIAREVRSRRDEGIVIGQMGNLHEDQGRFNDALACYREALAINREVGNRRFEGEALCNVGAVLAKLGHAGPAREALQPAEALFRELGDPLDLGKLLCVRGFADLAGGDPDAARAALGEAETVAAELAVGPDADLCQQIARLRKAFP